jgi:hypothetical protein
LCARNDHVIGRVEANEKAHVVDLIKLFWQPQHQAGCVSDDRQTAQ